MQVVVISPDDGQDDITKVWSLCLHPSLAWPRPPSPPEHGSIVPDAGVHAGGLDETPPASPVNLVLSSPVPLNAAHAFGLWQATSSHCCSPCCAS